MANVQQFVDGSRHSSSDTMDTCHPQYEQLAGKHWSATRVQTNATPVTLPVPAGVPAPPKGAANIRTAREYRVTSGTVGIALCRPITASGPPARTGEYAATVERMHGCHVFYASAMTVVSSPRAAPFSCFVRRSAWWHRSNNNNANGFPSTAMANP